MTASPQGPGWWRATDGRWYPPETHPHYRMAPPGPANYPVQYGQPQGLPQPWAQGAVTPTNAAATAGGVLGISGAILSLIPFIGILFGLLMGTLAIIFSGIGLSRTSQIPIGKGMAITGLVLGILTVIFKLIPGINLL